MTALYLSLVAQAPTWCAYIYNGAVVSNGGKTSVPLTRLFWHFSRRQHFDASKELDAIWRAPVAVKLIKTSLLIRAFRSTCCGPCKTMLRQWEVHKYCRETLPELLARNLHILTKQPTSRTL